MEGPVRFLIRGRLSLIDAAASRSGIPRLIGRCSTPIASGSGPGPPEAGPAAANNHHDQAFCDALVAAFREVVGEPAWPGLR